MLTKELIYDALLDCTGSVLVVVDQDGYCCEINDVYLKKIRRTREETINHHILDFYPNSRLHIIAKTGIAEIGEPTDFFGEAAICSRVPIYKDGEVKGAIGSVIFNNPQGVPELLEKMNALTTTLELYKNKFGRINTAKYTIDDIIGQSDEMKELKFNLLRVAQSTSNVLITGESGTGKELIAHAVHNAGLRQNQPFISVNCGAIPPELLESEFFGYEEGSFTGGKKGGKTGLFQAADKGTLFLDEIGDLPFNMQVKLLRTIQEGEVRKVGSSVNTPVDCRIIAATNRNLLEMVQQNRFRSDLYYRLNVVNISIPPLRNRTEDLEPLIHHCIDKLKATKHIDIRGFSAEAIACMKAYDWPGNVRELENIIERASNYMGPDKIISVLHLPSLITHHTPSDIISLQELVARTEKNAIIAALLNNNGRKSAAARDLNISRPSLYEKMRKYQIDTSQSTNLIGNHGK